MEKKFHLCSKGFDFLCPQVNRSSLSEVEDLLKDLEAANRALLHPPVIIWVSSHKDTADIVLQKSLRMHISCSQT